MKIKIKEFAQSGYKSLCKHLAPSAICEKQINTARETPAGRSQSFAGRCYRQIIISREGDPKAARSV
jgi:hypothetical protein